MTNDKVSKVNHDITFSFKSIKYIKIIAGGGIFLKEIYANELYTQAASLVINIPNVLHMAH